jgi:hypothetical protein
MHKIFQAYKIQKFDSFHLSLNFFLNQIKKKSQRANQEKNVEKSYIIEKGIKGKSKIMYWSLALHTMFKRDFFFVGFSSYSNFHKFLHSKYV